jgi:type II secretory pathway pseudopilin PulG
MFSRGSLFRTLSNVCLVVFILLLLAVMLVPPFPRNSRFGRQNMAMQQAREIGQVLYAYAQDHGQKYPHGNTSTEIFQRLLDEGYVNDPAIFYLPLPGKVKPTVRNHKPQPLNSNNIGFDVTVGGNTRSPHGLPLVFTTGYQVTYARGAEAIPDSFVPHGSVLSWFSHFLPWDDSSDEPPPPGIAVYYVGNNSKFISPDFATHPDGVLLDFVPPDFSPGSGETYRQLTPGPPSEAEIAAPKPAPVPPSSTAPAAGQPWVNLGGVTFVPAGTDGVLFSIWDVRVQDFAAFVDATGYDATVGMFRNGTVPWKSHGVTWRHPGFTQAEDEPVVKVSWNDAVAFCTWSTKHERSAGKLAPNQYYRLPTDAEWSKAVGLDEAAADPPWKKSNKIRQVFSWGTDWPPPRKGGNYDASPDGYGSTSPVGSFPANRYGLYDMGGNVWQWCEDLYGNTNGHRVLRGGSWIYNGGCVPFLSYRLPEDAGIRRSDAGFRVVLVVSPDASPGR